MVNKWFTSAKYEFKSVSLGSYETVEIEWNRKIPSFLDARQVLYTNLIDLILFVQK